jgi:hypothetical protein
MNSLYPFEVEIRWMPVETADSESKYEKLRNYLDDICTGLM